MRDFIYEVMTDYSTLVIFFHVLSAVIWVGGMVALWFFTKNENLEVPFERRFISRAALFKKFFIFIAPFILLLFITSLFMALGYKDNAMDMDGFVLDAHNLDMFKNINIKGSIWTVMTMNMIFMAWILSKASCRLCKTQKSTDCMWLVSTYLLPINVILGVIEIYIGVFLRSSF